MTLYGLLVSLCGLTQPEAARIAGVQPITVRFWVAGRRAAPPHQIEGLRLLWHDIEDAATRIIADHEPAVIEAMADADDEIARRYGLPIAAAWRQAVALAYARHTNGAPERKKAPPA